MIQEQSGFANFALCAPLLQALQDLQFETPSPIQAQTIPKLLQGQDIIGLAQTGTGKTAAFALPILNTLNLSDKNTQALILAPTRELAIQVAEHFETLARHLRGFASVVLCGGQDYRTQLRSLKDGVQVVVGTPGRVLDHIERGSLKLNHLRTFVLDEADEMLRMGFIEDVETVLANLPEQKQIALFSATMPGRIRQIANQYLNTPHTVEIKSETATVKSILQQFLFASEKQKADALIRVLSVEDYQGAIVFVKTKARTEEVAKSLHSQRIRATAIHGDITQGLRERIISQFREGLIDVLVATDVAARGLDVERVTHVINYDMAQDCETYVHRIGRTGRAGRSGVTILFATPKEGQLLNRLERHTRQRIQKIAVPTDHMIMQFKQQQFLKKITDRLAHEHLSSYRQLLKNYMQDKQVDALDVASALALLLQQDKPLNAPLQLPAFTEVSSGKERRSLSTREENKTKSRFPANREAQDLYRLSVGRVHGVKPGHIVGAIANEGGLNSRHITGLTIHQDYSLVSLPKGMPNEVMQVLKKAWVCGRQLNLMLQP